MSATSMSDSNAPDVEHTSNEIMNGTDSQSDGVAMDVAELENEQDMLVTAEHNQADGTALNPGEVEPVVPERSYAPVSVVTERFLRAILAHIPIERIAELHLFSPLRQGGVETGIAVIAADVEVTEIDAVLPEGSLELALGDDERLESGDSDLVAEAADSTVGEQLLAVDDSGSVTDSEQQFTTEDTEDPEGSVESESSERDAETVSFDGGNDQRDDAIADGEMAIDVDDGDDTDREESAAVTASVDVDAGAADDDSPYADDEVVTHSDEHEVNVDGAATIAESVIASADATGTPDAPQPAAAPVRHVRHTVYTARYRLVLKGPDRGKWEADVVNEADAPLVAVETVVRGVQRRAGEATETVRYDAAQIAQALRMVTPS